MGIKLYVLNLIFKVKEKNFLITLVASFIIILFGFIIMNGESSSIDGNSESCLSDNSYASFCSSCKELYEKNKEILILVNCQNPIPDSYETDLKYTANQEERVANVLYNDLVLMLKDAQDVGYKYWIASGYRSIETQQGLTDEHIDTYISEGMSLEEAQNETYKILEKPGFSEHHTGLAIDFLSSDNLNMDESQENSEGNKWLRDNCYKYGFILRYPRGKESLTHISYEPWHFRYVGRDVSKFIYENNLTLEEFYSYL